MMAMHSQMVHGFGVLAWPRVWAWCMRQMHRGALAFAGALLGGCLVLGLTRDVWQAHDQVRQAFDAARLALQSQPQPQPTGQAEDAQAAHAGKGLWTRLPHRLPPDTAIELQQALQAQGLTVLSLRAMPVVSGGVLQSQSLALRLQGDFASWTRTFQAWVVSGPVVSIERMVVSPLDKAKGVQLDVVVRLWFKTGTGGHEAWPAWPRVAAAKLAMDLGAQGPGVFALAVGPDSKVSVPQTFSPEAPMRTDDLMTWPVERIRLWGTWQDGERWQAVLSAGGVWVPVRVGQRVSRQAHKVLSIRQDALILRTPQGQNIELKVAEGAR